MREIWKPVARAPAYEVSSLGRLRRDGKLLSPSTYGRYVIARMSVDGKAIYSTMHRLVAIAFCERRPGADEVNHKNFDKHDNRAANLEWVTKRENAAHARPRYRPQRGSANASAQLDEDDVRYIRWAYLSGVARQALADGYSVCKGTIDSIVTYKNWAHVP